MRDGVSVTGPPVVVEIRYRPAERSSALREGVRAGLTATPKQLSPQWFYDERGSRLFDEITRLPEYYLTARERDLLREHADDIAALTEANTLVELGSGTSEKTRLLLDALGAAGYLRRFVPFDVSEPTLQASAAALVDKYPGIQVHGVVGDFERHLTALPAGRRRLIAFLGSTIGNLPPPARARFLSNVKHTLSTGEHVLLGVDLVRDPRRLHAAYNDSAGVTAEFNLNILLVLNRELGADFDLGQFKYVARWDAAHERIEMVLHSTIDQTVHVAELGINVAFAAGEEMRTEFSYKFRPEGVAAEVRAAGLRLVRWWPHRSGDFAVVLARA